MEAMKPLAGRAAIVTGAAEGPKASLGAAFARRLAADGASVVLADVRDCRPVVTDIEAAGGTAVAVAADVSKEASVKELVEAATREFGPVSILVNNAAIGSNTPPVALDDLSVETWDELMAVNVRGSFLCAKAVAPLMASRGYGKIVNIGSTTSQEGLALRLHYVVAKGAIATMTRALARELGPKGIRVNTLAPGFVMSRAVEQAMSQRPGLHKAVLAARSIPSDVCADDLLGTLSYLCGAASDAITGQFISVDCGAYFT